MVEQEQENASDMFPSSEAFLQGAYVDKCGRSNTACSVSDCTGRGESMTAPLLFSPQRDYDSVPLFFRQHMI